MCGIVAVFQKNIGLAGSDLFKDLLYCDVIRGKHSTGIVSIGRNTECIKKAIPSYDFLELSKVQQAITRADNGLIGHNRWATMGAKNSENAHPFSHGSIHLVHNGTLTNKASLPDSKLFDTDSETIAYNLSHRNTKEVLEELEGAYALVWYDEDDKQVHIAKNNERTLHFFLLKEHPSNKPAVVLCSEEDMAAWLINRGTKFTIEHSSAVPCGKHITMDLDTLSYTDEDFEVKKPAGVHYGSGGSHSYRGNYYGKTTLTYPHNEWTVFEVILIDNDGTVMGESLDKDYDIVVRSPMTCQPKIAAAGGFVVGDMYYGKISCVDTVLKEATVVYNSVQIVEESKSKKDVPVCGFCEEEVTEDQQDGSETELFCGGLVHTKCFDEYMGGNA